MAFPGSTKPKLSGDKGRKNGRSMAECPASASPGSCTTAQHGVHETTICPSGSVLCAMDGDDYRFAFGSTFSGDENSFFAGSLYCFMQETFDPVEVRVEEEVQQQAFRFSIVGGVPHAISAVNLVAAGGESTLCSWAETVIQTNVLYTPVEPGGNQILEYIDLCLTKCDISTPLPTPAPTAPLPLPSDAPTLPPTPANPIPSKDPSQGPTFILFTETFPPLNFPSTSPTKTVTTPPTSPPSSSPTPKPTTSPSQEPSQRIPPSNSPTRAPTANPSPQPTHRPSASPSSHPSRAPSPAPSPNPTAHPTKAATLSPTNNPSFQPTNNPTQSPALPTESPSSSPMKTPTRNPTISPSGSPTRAPSPPPSAAPTNRPTAVPSSSPTASPSTSTPSKTPSSVPSAAPTNRPTGIPTSSPTASPSNNPSSTPTNLPSAAPTEAPSSNPTAYPSKVSSPSSSPTFQPTVSPNHPTQSPALPSVSPTALPSSNPTRNPTSSPSKSPTFAPSWSPTNGPTSSPSKSPTSAPSRIPSASPSASPNSAPSFGPTTAPSRSPASVPSKSPSSAPSVSPTFAPSSPPTSVPSNTPTAAPMTSPTSTSTGGPAVAPSKSPDSAPSVSPTFAPSGNPTTTLSKAPNAAPTTSPTSTPTINPTTSPSKDILAQAHTAAPSRISPTGGHTSSPSKNPTAGPTTRAPTLAPTSIPSESPTVSPSTHTPTAEPTMHPTGSPTTSGQPSLSSAPSSLPTSEFSFSEQSLVLRDNRAVVVGADPNGLVRGRRELQKSESECDNLFLDLMEARIRSEISSVITLYELLSVSVFNVTKFYDRVLSAVIYEMDVKVDIRSPINKHNLEGYVAGGFETEHDRSFVVNFLRNADCPIFAAVTDFELVLARVATFSPSSKDPPLSAENTQATILVAGSVAALAAAGVMTALFLFVRLVGGRRFRTSVSSLDGRADDDFDGANDHEEISEIGFRPAPSSSHEVSTLGDPPLVGAISRDENESVDREVSTNDSFSLDYEFQRTNIHKAFSSWSSVSESSGTAKSNHFMVTDDDTLDAQYVVGEHFEVYAPKGTLGLVLETVGDGIPVVQRIKSDSILRDVVRVGDRLLSVDGVDVLLMHAVDVSNIIASKQEQEERRFVFSRPTKRENQGAESPAPHF